MADDRQAWVVRMNTGGGDVVETGISEGCLLLGWSGAEGLISCDDYEDFRKIVHDAHYSDDTDYKRSGQAASQLWLFVHEMNVGDRIVVPHPGVFYAAEVTGPAQYDDSTLALTTDTAHRRPVRWLNGGEPIPRTFGRSALISRMRSWRTVTYAGDLVTEIEDAIQIGATDAPTLATSLRQALIETTKQHLLTGYMDERRFEELVRDLILAVGAIDARIVPRRADIGADIEAEFSIGHLTTIPARIQVKYWDGQAGQEPVDQLMQAMDDVELGIVVTTASFTDEARQYAADQSSRTAKQLILVDGDELCRLIVDYGLDSVLAARIG